MKVARGAAHDKERMKTTSIIPAVPICTPEFKSAALPPDSAATSIILDKEHRLSRKARNSFRVVRAFLSGLADRSVFQDVSLGREVSVVFTSNGPLIYRWEVNNEKPPVRS